ncbi:hypothetical protein NDU88_002655 [Pleurodeles waltl]|uniref:Uncharacterized protein n=1 Tax=Pleurodeles waltl TaxID=8319 RepID=A0AAV7VD42_PLEWA|nr:hypothetical protein NDU88_002655 [Pleurodeles waltl]
MGVTPGRLPEQDNEKRWHGGRRGAVAGVPVTPDGTTDRGATAESSGEAERRQVKQATGQKLREQQPEPTLISAVGENSRAALNCERQSLLPTGGTPPRGELREVQL